MDPELAIQVNHISKAFKLPHEKSSSIKSAVIHFYRRNRGYELRPALRDVSFDIKKGEFFAIVGRNGSGKSTMLKMLAGIYVPDGGSINIQGKLTPFIELGVGFNPELTGRENLYLNGALLGFSRKEMEAMYMDIVEFAELEDFMDQKLKNYSSGMQVRLAFSLSIRAQADILLIDEVLAVGDADFQRKCFTYFKTLKKNKRTVVFVSHDMSSVKEFCDRGILIDGGEVKFQGSAKEVATEYTKLFMNNKKSKGGRQKVLGERIGNGDIEITSVEANLKGEDLIIDVTAKVHEKIDRLIYGLHIEGLDGQEVTAMNNRMIQTDDLRNLKPGQSVNFTWKMLNIFSDGRYGVTLTMVDDVGTALDWLTGAASFTVERDDHSTTSVMPPVSVSHKIN